MTKTQATKIFRRLSAKTVLVRGEKFQLEQAKEVLGIK